MHVKISQRLGSLAALAASVCLSLPAAAQSGYTQNWRYAHHAGHRLRPYQQVAYARPLTIPRRRYYPPVVAAPDPYHGPQAIVTAPIAIASTIVSIPFQILGTVFPASGDPGRNPLVLIGAPIHAAGMVAHFPFHVAGSVFGAPPAQPPTTLN